MLSGSGVSAGGGESSGSDEEGETRWEEVFRLPELEEEKKILAAQAADPEASQPLPQPQPLPHRPHTRRRAGGA